MKGFFNMFNETVSFAHSARFRHHEGRGAGSLKFSEPGRHHVRLRTSIRSTPYRAEDDCSALTLLRARGEAGPVLGESIDSGGTQRPDRQDGADVSVAALVPGDAPL